jgi:hypothetical protein
VTAYLDRALTPQLPPPKWLVFRDTIGIIGRDLSPVRRLMMSKEAKRYTPRFKFQVVMETLKSSKPRSANMHEERTNVMAEATSRMFFAEKATNSVGKNV